MEGGRSGEYGWTMEDGEFVLRCGRQLVDVVSTESEIPVAIEAHRAARLRNRLARNKAWFDEKPEAE